jgi:hypothetical protein
MRIDKTEQPTQKQDEETFLEYDDNSDYDLMREYANQLNGEIDLGDNDKEA